MNLFRLTISQMAKLNNVTSETLRHYDRVGLFHPQYTDKKTNYRYYHINQSAQLDTIQYLQAYGVSLEDIKIHLTSKESDDLYSLLYSQMNIIDQKIEQLSLNRKKIERLIKNHELQKNLPPNGTAFLEYLPSRKIFVHQSKENYFAQRENTYELMLRELKQYIGVLSMPLTYFHNVGTIMRKKYLLCQDFFANESFFFVEDDYAGPGTIEVLPAGLYICLCASDFSKESEYARYLLREAQRLGYSTSGDYICEVIEELLTPLIGERNLFFKIQIPLKKLVHST